MKNFLICLILLVSVTIVYNLIPSGTSGDFLDSKNTSKLQKKDISNIQKKKYQIKDMKVVGIKKFRKKKKVGKASVTKVPTRNNKLKKKNKYPTITSNDLRRENSQKEDEQDVIKDKKEELKEPSIRQRGNFLRENNQDDKSNISTNNNFSEPDVLDKPNSITEIQDVTTDGKQLIFDRTFSSKIVSCSGQTSWDDNFIFHPLPSGTSISIICKTVSGDVLIESDLNKL